MKHGYYIIDDCWNIILLYLLGYPNEWKKRNRIGYIKKYDWTIQNLIGLNINKLIKNELSHITCYNSNISNPDVFYNCIRFSDIINNIDLWNMELNNIHFNMLCELINQLPRLKILNLCNNYISNVNNICKPLTSNIPLTKLGLSNNNISDIDMLLESLNHNTNLKKLYLNHNNIRNIYCLRNLILKNYTLKRLSLSYNLITNVHDIHELLKYSTLNYLNLSGNTLMPIDYKNLRSNDNKNILSLNSSMSSIYENKSFDLL